MTAIDSVKYAVGASDKFQGTGVWSFLKAERPSKENKQPSKKKN
eukprot:CAMPEP_0185256662 /NCGR_PEP_ID=MMETSP1359-20130426/5744_1 /TAXON_ID=552665 /ORGANISM="Bigelowiella longifila, Strain CCMP242" /LENGTH=43 /DNA_ID= /DNA_START= /DNA_END= /DNA_ORIENTATION=